MSMFDNIQCEYPLPGLPEGLIIEFQTKSFDCPFLDNYKITKQGELLVEDFDIEDRSDPNAEGLMRLVGCMAKIPKGWSPVNFTGNINFYGDKDSGSLLLISFSEGTKKKILDNGEEVEVEETEWFEYDALFKDGHLISVERSLNPS
jgi:hypothetical protein